MKDIKITPIIVLSVVVIIMSIYGMVNSHLRTQRILHTIEVIHGQ